MRTLILSFLLSFSFLAAANTNPKVVLETNHGNIEVELFQKEAPESTKNFLSYVDAKFYDGLIFHRVISDFMIQGGGFDRKLNRKATRDPIKNEATNKISNTTGTIAMARTGVINSATSQFFINVKNNTFLNHQNTSQRGYGYAVFGKVTSGMDVVNKIRTLPTAKKAQFPNMPTSEAFIKKAYRKKAK